jgi:hypothetical protein
MLERLIQDKMTNETHAKVKDAAVLKLVASLQNRL